MHRLLYLWDMLDSQIFHSKTKRTVHPLTHHPHPRRLLCLSINGSGQMTSPPVKMLSRKSSSFSVSKSMTRILRHRGLHREIDGATEWNRLLQTLCRYHYDAPRWTNRLWMDHLLKGSNKKRFQYCLNSDGSILYMRAVQGHSGGYMHCWIT